MLDGIRRAVLVLICGLGIAGLTACGSDSTPAPSGSTSQLTAAPTGNPGDTELGPLAVIDSSGGSLARGGTGPIHIGAYCVTMTREDGDVLLLIWLVGQVSWDEQERVITFVRATEPDEEPITVRDGDIVTVGGESLEGDVPVERELVWLATPNPSCSGGEAWIVNGMTKP